MQPDPRYTVIMTHTVKASEIGSLRNYGPLFIDDADPQTGLDSWPTKFIRKVVTTSDHFGSSLGREQITVEFADGTPGRVFDLDDDVELFTILPGTDLTGSE
jgi:hypothetical protein